MLSSCELSGFSGTTRQQGPQRLIQQRVAGANNPDRIQGWYKLAGGAGFLIVSCDDIRELTAFHQPGMDLMSFDVRAIGSLDDTERINRLRSIASG